MPPSVTAIVVSYNSADDLPECLESLAAQSWPDLRIVLVDNASMDDSVEIGAGAKAEVLSLRANIGFSAANNAGLARATSDYVLFVNPDARLSQDFVRLLVEAMERCPRAGSATGKLLKGAMGPLDSTGIVVDRARLQPSDRGEGDCALERFDGEGARGGIMGASAAAALYRREVLMQAAPDGEVFDEDFFAYFEDVDLAWRVRSLGWSCIYVPDARCIHPRSGPWSKGTQMRRRADINRVWTFVKNESWTWPELITMLPRQILWEALRTISRTIQDPGYAFALARSASMLPRMLRKRRLIKSLGRTN